MYRSLLASAPNARGPSTILLRHGKCHLPRAIGASHSNGRTFNRRNANRRSSQDTGRFQSTAAYPPYEKPPNVEQWEKLATKELSKSTKTVDSLRADRVTPVRFPNSIVNIIVLFEKGSGLIL